MELKNCQQCSLFNNCCICVTDMQALLDKLNGQSQCHIKLPSLLAALSSLLEKGHHNLASDKTADLSTVNDARTSGRSDDTELATTCRVSPDSTAGCVDSSLASYSQHCWVKTEQTDTDEPAVVMATKPFLPDDCRLRSKCDAQALVGTVYHQLREAEQQSNAGVLSRPPPLLPASMTENTITDVVPDCPLVVDEALLELAAEARQIPAAGSEREVLIQQVIRSVMDAHHKTCSYTREEVDAGFQRYRQVCHGRCHYIRLGSIPGVVLSSSTIRMSLIFITETRFYNLL